MLWTGSVLGASDVIQYGGQYGRHLGFYRKLEILKKTAEIGKFIASHVKCGIIKTISAQHSSSKCKKLSYQKNTCSTVTF